MLVSSPWAKILTVGLDGSVETTRDRLLKSAEDRFLQKGYTATSVDEICGGASATKGAFFHHFRSKEQVGLMVLEAHVDRRMHTLGARAPKEGEDPIKRVFDYVDQVTQYLLDSHQPMCLVASLTVELAEVNDRFRGVCAQLLAGWREGLTAMFEAALAARTSNADGIRAHALASQFIASFHGGLLLHRALQDPANISETMRTFRHHLELVFGQPNPS